MAGERSIMIEITGDFWDHAQDYDVLVVPTNGVLTKDNKLVMGAGLARQFRDKYAGIDSYFGMELVFCETSCSPKFLRLNNAYYYGMLTTDNSEFGSDSDKEIAALQTKAHWKDISDYDLIKWSVGKLWVEFLNEKVLMTRPGCGLGGLVWSEVKEMISFLGDNFTVINKE